MVAVAARLQQLGRGAVRKARRQGASAASSSQQSDSVRVRFAPSPTGYLHVGGARTALFNWLYAKNKGGKFILRVEDTDQERSTREAERMVMEDLRWLGLEWDEGPDVEGSFGPYRQSERASLYQEYAKKLRESGWAYPCFCTEEELEEMRNEAERKGLPPKYDGRWANADPELVRQKLEAGEPHVYRLRVPEGREVTVNDMVRGEVSWNTSEALGDFVILRSNGLPVYNFCVAVDDALMGVTHVLRAEEHLTNTMRQLLVYEGLGFSPPEFGHLSLILAPDKTKLSKRHGATSVADFREEGYLPEAMINFLALLGWNDGTDQEVYDTPDLVERFSVDRINKSPAVFDKEKLVWLNGQKLRAKPDEELASLFRAKWVEEGLVTGSAPSDAVLTATSLVRNQADLVKDCVDLLKPILAYGLEETLANDDAHPILEDGFHELADEALAAYDSGDLDRAVLQPGGFKEWMNGIGKRHGRKGRRLFMPMRIALTGSMQGPDIGEQVKLVRLLEGHVGEGGHLVGLDERMERLRSWRKSKGGG